MRFLLDESADLPLAAHLQRLGHDVTSIVRDYTRSIEDAEVLGIAHREQRILITNDRDFGELIVRQGLPHAGVILFRLRNEDVPTKIRRLDHVLAYYTEQLDQFLVVTQHSVRVRRV